ncbi:MAG: hypothetical protein HY046_14600 [Acidobacteria bacterium]|nr:hypothetical protein [Acidobacteriota bacterium]
MLESIKMGTVFIKEGTYLPKTLQLDSETCLPGWRMVKNLFGFGVGQKVQQAGWTFFFLGDEIKATVFGSTGQSTVLRAVQRILATLKAKRFNSLEISEVSSTHFLGLPYATVTAHARHIQESAFLFRSTRG